MANATRAEADLDGADNEARDERGARAWIATLKRAVKEFRRRNLTDAAAALTYYAVLSVFPLLLALVALVGVFGQYPQTVNAIMEIVGKVAPQSTVSTIHGTLTGVVQNKGGAGALLGVGLLGALWSASGYIGAFARASNSIYSVEEGRPAWKLRPLQIVIAAAMVVIVAFVAIAYVFSGKLASSAGHVIGVSEGAVTAWQIAKWPVMALVASLMLSLLYHLAPNVRQPRFRWFTAGGTLALLALAIASVGFAFYVNNFGSYNKTYGALGGVIVMLVWLRIANVAALLGAEVNAELERSRGALLGQAVEREPYVTRSRSRSAA
jgi:membrane protein